MPRHVVERGSVNGSEGTPNNNRSGNLPPKTPPTPPGFSHPPAGSGGFPPGPASMPPGSGMPAGQPYPNFPYGHAPNEYPIYQPPQKPGEELEQESRAPDSGTDESTAVTNEDSNTEIQQAQERIVPSTRQVELSADTSSNKRLLNPRLGLRTLLSIVVIGVVALAGATFVSRDGADSFDDELIDRIFVNGELATCDLGESFYQRAGWTDIYMPLADDNYCSGWVETSEGDLAADIVLGNRYPNDFQSSPALEGWSEKHSDVEDDPWCEMVSSDPVYARLTVSVAGPCEPLYPIARELSLLADASEGRKTRREEEKFPTEPPSVATEQYEKLILGSHSVGTALVVEAEDLKGATLRPTSVLVEPFGANAEQEVAPRICVEATVNVGAFRNESADTFRLPRLGIMNPSGQTTWLEGQGDGKDHFEYDDVDATYCGLHSGRFRHATLLLVNYDAVEDKLYPVWKIDLRGEEGLRIES